VALPKLMIGLHAEDAQMSSIQVLRPTLDDVFLELTGRSLRDAEMFAETTAENEEVGHGA
jgi:ABC-2 type transport system ATP-binding protein